MKKILLIILAGLLITVAILFVHPSKSLDQNLVLAEELMSDRPDSALKVLEKLNVNNLKGENKALYALLMTQAQFKNRKIVNSDSLIKVAYDYYITKSDSIRKAQVYFYLGRVDVNIERVNEALKNFQKASLSASKADNYNIMALIFSHWGILLQDRQLFDDALPILQKSLNYSRLGNDTLLQISVLKEIGKVYFLKKNHDKALKCYKSALLLAQLSNEKLYLPWLYNNLSILYKCKGEYNTAMHYINKSFSLKSNSSITSSWYFLKGDIFSLQNKYDSARYYLNKGKVDKDLISKIGYTALMSELEQRLGDFEKALIYLNQHIAYSDTFENNRRENTIAELQKKYDYSLIKNENTQLELQKKNRNVLILVVLIVSILIIWLITYRYNKVRCEKDLIIKEGKEQLQQMADALVEWELKVKEIQLKSKADIDSFVKWVLSKNEAWRKIERLTNMSTAEQIANKEEMKLTPSEIENLKEVVDICFNNFATRLSKRFPSVSEENIQYCCLLRTKISANSIAILLGVSDGSLVKRKYRLKKEISGMIGGCVSLEDFLLNF